MNFISKISLLMVVIFLLSTVNSKIFAADIYSNDDVAEHDTVDDCWVVYDNYVYDISDYVESHDVYMEIADWCGMDMTIDFETKAGIGRDHRQSSYSLLEYYKIGELEVETANNEMAEKDEAINTDLEDNILIEEDSTGDTSNNTDSINITNKNDEGTISDMGLNPYNLIIPLLVTVIIYWGSYLVAKRKLIKNFSLHKFNMIYNTLLLLSLIPAFGFGVFLILRYQFPALYEIKFDFLYWHVELSISMGVLAISHFIQRWLQYLSQVKATFK